jgi:Primase C terminal 2 (PriCT-2)/Bifunctional DNA primase/polymerase, N-terminal
MYWSREMISEIYDYIEAGFKVFGLHDSTGGACNCGDAECEAILKHPIMSNWQNVPHWSDEQIECFDEMKHFNSGFGVIVRDYLIVDVDARNGGVASFKKLCKDVPSVLDCAFIVNTGSGGGSQHYYFKLSDDDKKLSLVQKLDKYKGIDFKSSGFVVGSGSLHASGSNYETCKGYPQDVDFAPVELITLLTRQASFRVSNQGMDLDIDEQHIAALLSNCNPDCAYAEWVSIGMAVHHCFSGGGFDLWDSWSATGSKYGGSGVLQKHWHSFGKTSTPVGYGTLLHYAKEGGYCEPITFVYDGSLGVIDDVSNVDNVNNTDSNLTVKHLLDEPVDVRRPPDFVGELTQWINDQCLYPRENLAVAAALCAVSSLAGMRYTDGLDGMSANIIAFGVAGSGTGKEQILQSFLAIIKAAGVQAALHGGFKSEQEVMRNLIRHQAAFYCIDELGITLSKLQNASKKGGASYLEGIVGLVMSVYSKANGYLPITGDLKEDIKQKLIIEYAQIEKKIEKLAEDRSTDTIRSKLEDAKAQIIAAIQSVDDGLENPYLTVLGFTTPVTFNDLMTFEQATNGFMARAMIFSDLETNPKRKPKFVKKPMSEGMANSIRNLYSHGHYDMLASANERVQHMGDKSVIPTDSAACDLLNEVYERFYQLAETHKATTGLEAIARRGYELASKISLVCALPSGLRAPEHVRYGYALAMRDVEQKIKLAYSTDNKESTDGLAAKVLSIIDAEHGETLGVICNRLRGTPKAQIETLLARMTDSNMIKAVECIKTSTKQKYLRYFAV